MTQLQPETITGIFAVVTGVLLIFVFMQWLQTRGLKKRYRKLMAAGRADNLEELLAELQERVQRVEREHGGHETEIARLANQLKTMKANVGMMRYNAFTEKGSDLSFSIAFLNAQLDGVVLTGIHSRDETYIYAKPIEQGQSKYTLSPEEKQVIAQVASQRG